MSSTGPPAAWEVLAALWPAPAGVTLRPSRECIVPALILFSAASATAQIVPTGWKLIRDSKTACQIAVPPDWSLLSEAGGSAIFHDPSTGIAVVTSQPGQAFKPLSRRC